ncbi:hypothetical protein Cadr_000002723 [Camelus dromedarius]|uniref:Uncharacterized protein n=1 Tax=Camelus dromedarius TaxID=9838 RepID=A0A5N4C181_CAMDR|nr:hypothetical protein Cadr_000002723 [Camelus dromedarius]
MPSMLLEKKEWFLAAGLMGLGKKNVWLNRQLVEMLKELRLEGHSPPFNLDQGNVSSLVSQKLKKLGVENYGPKCRKAKESLSSTASHFSYRQRKFSKIPVVEPTGIPGPLRLTSTYFPGSHSANNLEVTRTISEIPQLMPAHPEITKKTPGSSLKKWKKRPQ